MVSELRLGIDTVSALVLHRHHRHHRLQRPHCDKPESTWNITRQIPRQTKTAWYKELQLILDQNVQVCTAPQVPEQPSLVFHDRLSEMSEDR
jgi:hypothetical protein